MMCICYPWPCINQLCKTMSTLPWELCFWMTVSLPRRGTASSYSYSHVSCAFVTSDRDRERNICVVKNENQLLYNVHHYIRAFMTESVRSQNHTAVSFHCLLELYWATCLRTLCLFESPELIENVKLIHKPVSLQPRGLINKGNWCYINAVSFCTCNFF